MSKVNAVFLVLGGTGRTGRHFVSLVLDEGHKVKVLVRNPEKMMIRNPNLELHAGSITDYEAIDELVNGVDYVVSMLGDAKLQSRANVNAAFVRKLVPAMRRHGVKRFLYQAGSLTRPYKEQLPLLLWILKNIFARFGNLLGQHRDNEAVLAYLVEEAQDIEWMVHRATLISDGPSKGVLVRSKTRTSLATFVDCAVYSYRTIMDASAIHTCDLSYYRRGK